MRSNGSKVGGLLASLALGMAVSGGASAAPVYFSMTQSDVLADGPAYLGVAIREQGTDIAFDITVDSSLFDLSGGGNFGMDKLSIAHDSAFEVSQQNIQGPDGWRFKDKGTNIGGFKEFDFQLMGTGVNRTLSLSFTISGIEQDTPEMYALGMAAHVGGFSTTNGETSAGFYGDPLVGAPAVPLPAAAWMFGTALLALFGWKKTAGMRARRRKGFAISLPA